MIQRQKALARKFANRLAQEIDAMPPRDRRVILNAVDKLSQEEWRREEIKP